jgi:hypothetical protein
MFIAALFIIAQKWKQTKCPSTYEWVTKMWYILFSSREEICTDTYYNMNEP